jgi:hypothetical protein
MARLVSPRRATMTGAADGQIPTADHDLEGAGKHQRHQRQRYVAHPWINCQAT